MLTGNIPAVGTMPQKYVNDATDEIDSVLGVLYKTPINMAPTPEDTPPGVGTVTRPSRLLIKRVSNFLASGRFMLATSAGGEDDQLHSYALYLVTSALATLEKIASGEIKLDGAELSGDPDEEGRYGPLISNVDSESNVEAFYDRIYMAPAWQYGVRPYKCAGG